MFRKTAIYSLILIVLCGGFVIYSCKEYALAFWEAWCFYNTKVTLPDTMIAIEEGKLKHVHLPKQGTSILIRYYGPDDCKECAVNHMKDNEEILELSNKTGLFEFVIIMAPQVNEQREIMEKVISLNTSLCVFFDTSFYLESLDVIPTHPEMHTFLLSKEMKPVFIGNPLQNKTSLERFNKLLTN